MNMSEKIDELAAALSQLQGEVKDAQKDRKGYGYDYADLSQVLEIGRPLMAKYGLALSQFPGSASEKVVVESILMHKSGQWISGALEMGVSSSKNMTLAQSIGSVITYARRYSIGGILGITQSDNDAHSSSKDIHEEQKKIKEERILPPIQKISEHQANSIKLIASKDRIDRYLQKTGLNRVEDMSLQDYNLIMDTLRIEGVDISNKQEDIAA